MHEDTAVNDEVDESDVEDDAEPSNEIKSNGNRSRRIIWIGGSVLLVAIIGGIFCWLYARRYESTDDAYIEGDIVQISPKVAAYVSHIYVKNNQFVHKGDLLLDLDPKDLEVKLEQAKAQLEAARSQKGLAEANAHLTTRTTNAVQTTARSNLQTAQNNVEQTRLASNAKESQISQAVAAQRTAEASLAQTKAQIPKTLSDVKLAETEYNRRRTLFDRGDISRQSLDQVHNALQTALANLDAARKQVVAAHSRVDEAAANVRTAKESYRQSLAQVEISRSQVDESQGRLEDANAGPQRVEVSQSQIDTADAGIMAAKASVHQAELELQYAKLYAPEDGFVARKTVEEGQLVQVGMPLMAISQSDEVWIVANFKETQLEHMEPGQSVEIEVDAFPSEKYRGHVESLQAGTGSKFSVLPAENATGNFVKVVQRVPVKIVFDESPEKVKRLVPGMSVEPSVKVR